MKSKGPLLQQSGKGFWGLHRTALGVSLPPFATSLTWWSSGSGHILLGLPNKGPVRNTWPNREGTGHQFPLALGTDPNRDVSDLPQKDRGPVLISTLPSLWFLSHMHKRPLEYPRNPHTEPRLASLLHFVALQLFLSILPDVRSGFEIQRFHEKGTVPTPGQTMWNKWRNASTVGYHSTCFLLVVQKYWNVDSNLQESSLLSALVAKLRDFPQMSTLSTTV